MTENKRFTMDEDGNITDTVEDRTLYVENRYTECKYFTNLLNELNEENQRLKKALLFFVDVSNSECSSNWRRDMENDCQRLFNCSYEEAKEKYGDYDSNWWELGL